MLVADRLIFVDLGLPDGAGLATLRRVRDSAKRVPVVVITGWDSVFSEKLLAEGASAYINKGELGCALLIDTIVNLVRRTSPTPSATAAAIEKDASVPSEIGPLCKSLQEVELVATTLAIQSASLRDQTLLENTRLTVRHLRETLLSEYGRGS